MVSRSALIIDSQEQDIQHLKGILEDGGYGVAVVLNGEEGLRLAHDLFPEVVLLSIQSPALKAHQNLHQFILPFF